MARIARVVVPGVGHHVTQRGVRSMNIFWDDEDKESYIDILSNLSKEGGLDVHAYCLMDNHIHLLVVPESDTSLSRVIGEAHRLYTRKINFRHKVRGHLFQERFFSCPLDESHYIATARYIEQNPVRAKMCGKAWDYVFSSARYHVGEVSHDKLLTKLDWHYDVDDWKIMLQENLKQIDSIRKNTRTGRPLGNKGFIEDLEILTKRVLRPKKAGRPIKIN